MLQMFKRFTSAQGFTLIELLVVLGILGILAIALLAAINPVAQLQKGNDARRKADLESMQHALELYYQDNGKYPPSTGNKINGINWGSAWTVGGQSYMAKLPADPLAAHKYIYYSPPGPPTNGQTYYLYANLERGKYDPQACNSGNACTSMSGSGFPGGNSCGATCNYGVSSPNVAP